MKKVLTIGLMIVAVSQSYAQQNPISLPKINKETYLQTCLAGKSQITAMASEEQKALIEASYSKTCECIADKIDFDKMNQLTEKQDFASLGALAGEAATSCAVK